MKLNHLIEAVLSLSGKEGMSRLEMNRVAYMACYYYRENTNEDLIREKWTMDKYGPYMQAIGRILSSHRKVKRVTCTNHYGREMELFVFTGKPNRKLSQMNREMGAIRLAMDDFMNLNYIEFNHLLRNTESG